MRVQETSQA